MEKEFSQFNLDIPKKTLEDFFDIKGNTLTFKGIFQTENFSGTQGVRIRNEGLSTGSLEIAGDTIDSVTTTIPGALTHTGNTAGFYGTAPIAKQTVTLGNTNGEISGLAIGVAYTQAEVVALRDKCEELADDVRALKTALAALGLMT